jgi:hypothetical protein
VLKHRISKKPDNCLVLKQLKSFASKINEENCDCVFRNIPDELEKISESDEISLGASGINKYLRRESLIAAQK